MRIVALVAFFAAACSGAETTPDAPATEPEPTIEPAAEPAPAAAPSNPSGWLDASAMQEAWAGAQVVGGSRAVAWNVEGTTVTVDDGTGPVERTLEFRSPCDVAEKNEEAGSSTIHVFAVDGDDRYMGLGSAAVPVAEGEYLACAGGKHVHVTADGCTVWKNRFGRWEQDDAGIECAMTETSLTVGSTQMDKVGGVYLTSQLAGAKVVEHADFAAAQAALQ